MKGIEDRKMSDWMNGEEGRGRREGADPEPEKDIVDRKRVTQVPVDEAGSVNERHQTEPLRFRSRYLRR